MIIISILIVSGCGSRSGSNSGYKTLLWTTVSSLKAKRMKYTTFSHIYISMIIISIVMAAVNDVQCRPLQSRAGIMLFP